MSDDLPLVVCVTPFFGRISLLANALGCFESQEYPNKILLVSNDTGRDISLKSESMVIVQNHEDRFRTLGAKRTHMREEAIRLGAKYISHWDDDDFYMPSFLREGVAHMEQSNSLACRPSPVGFGTNIAPMNNNLWFGPGVRARIDHCQRIPYDSFFMCSSEPYAEYDDIGCGENLPFRYKAEELGRWSFYTPEQVNCCYGWFKQIPHATTQKGGFIAGTGEFWKLGPGLVEVASPINFGRIVDGIRRAMDRPSIVNPAPPQKARKGPAWKRRVR